MSHEIIDLTGGDDVRNPARSTALDNAAFTIDPPDGAGRANESGIRMEFVYDPMAYVDKPGEVPRYQVIAGMRGVMIGRLPLAAATYGPSEAPVDDEGVYLALFAQPNGGLLLKPAHLDHEMALPFDDREYAVYHEDTEYSHLHKVFRKADSIDPAVDISGIFGPFDRGAGDEGDLLLKEWCWELYCGGGAVPLDFDRAGWTRLEAAVKRVLMKKEGGRFVLLNKDEIHPDCLVQYVRRDKAWTLV